MGADAGLNHRPVVQGHRWKAWCASCRAASGVPAAHLPRLWAGRLSDPLLSQQKEKQQLALQISGHHPRQPSSLRPCHTTDGSHPHISTRILKGPLEFKHLVCYPVQWSDQCAICLLLNLESSYCGRNPPCPRLTEEITPAVRIWGMESKAD
uniref:Uncharacterized protein n=1 Tax=Rhinolophus ferrumequinum TaxID=59479 RepID=A0A671EI62_RHIFE